ncbi:MAG: response regulator [Candidatus Syntrophoarchaeum sp.]|nr:response regulator [Candidatus Syntrophoarchaeum sp.]
MECTILLVDDEESIHELLPLFLVRKKKHRFTVHSAINGEAGVEMYDKLRSDGQRPDFVLMDLKMPVMDGVEATKKILESDPEANIYLFTAYTGTEEESGALKAGAKGTIGKAADWYGTVENIINLTDKL